MNSNSNLFEGAEIKSTVFLGSYPQTAAGNDKTPIEWLVLKKKRNKLLLVSEYGLDCKPYHPRMERVNWGTCFLREWLNDSFYNMAFNDNEKALIVKSTIKAERNPAYWYTDPVQDTEDNIFLLSVSEAEMYFFDDTERICVATDYAKGKSVRTNKDNVCWWLLRTPGMGNYTAIVRRSGDIHKYGCQVIGRDDGLSVTHGGNLAVRPALWVNLKS